MRESQNVQFAISRLSEAQHVIIVCHGPGSQAVMDLLKSRGTSLTDQAIIVLIPQLEVKRKVRGIIHIAATGLPPRTPQDEMQQWYRQVGTYSYSGIS